MYLIDHHLDAETKENFAVLIQDQSNFFHTSLITRKRPHMERAHAEKQLHKKGHTEENMHIEIACAFTKPQQHISINIPVNTSLTKALQHTSCQDILQQLYACVPRQDLVFGIYAQIISNPDTYLLQPGDRIEIYRPLLTNPKTARHLRSICQGYKLERLTPQKNP